MVEGVDEVHYSNKIVVREIKDAAKESLVTQPQQQQVLSLSLE